jgi:small-conductance mechanosensitive channel
VFGICPLLAGAAVLPPATNANPTSLTGVVTTTRQFWLDFLTDAVNPNTRIGAVAYAIVIGVIAWLVGRAGHLAVERVLQRNSASVDQTAVRFLAPLARIVIWLLAFLAYAHLIPALDKLAGAGLATAGVVSVVLGMAAQNTLGNLISGISLVLYRPFQLGDHLQLSAPGGVESGVVENISLGYTILRTGDERRMVIPNSVIASQTVFNLSMTRQPFPYSISITIEHDADADKARKILVDLAAHHPKVVGSPSCRITNLSGAGVTLTLTTTAATSLAAPDMKSDLLEGAKQQFEKAGIQIHRDIVSPAQHK